MSTSGNTVDRDPRSLRSVLVLVNPKSGIPRSFSAFRAAMDRHWDIPGIDLSYQFCQSVEDGVAKARAAKQRGVDTILVVGGDGTISTVGRELVGGNTKLGSIPTGSGNGFARHFGIPLSPSRAAEALARGGSRAIDVGIMNGTPFLVTCSMAWDAAIVRSFMKMPTRGIIPYIFAGAYELFDYRPQAIDVTLDGGEAFHFPDPLVFTVANLTEYGGGARIAPEAQPDDGYLELVVALRQDAAKLIANVVRLFDGTIRQMPEVVFRRFRSLRVRRQSPAAVQIDGELVDAPAEFEIRVAPHSLRVLVPGR